MAEIVVVHGTPGSGKSTQSQRLAESQIEDLQIFHLSVGNRIRGVRTGSIRSAFSPNQKSGSETLDHHGINNIVFEYVSECPSSSIVLVDGYPRFVEAVGLFINRIQNNNHRLLGCLNLTISDQTCVTRLTSRGTRLGERALTPEFIQDRLNVHHAFTLPAVNALSELTSVLNVDAEPVMLTVWINFLQAFLKLKR